MAPMGGKDGQGPHAEQVPRLRAVRDLDVERPGRPSGSVVLGFRRRCGWCGVHLRAWQVNLCRACKPRTGDCGIYLQSGGAPCGEAERWYAEPDGPPWWASLCADYGREFWRILRSVFGR